MHGYVFPKTAVVLCSDVYGYKTEATNTQEPTKKQILAARRSCAPCKTPIHIYVHMCIYMYTCHCLGLTLWGALRGAQSLCVYVRVSLSKCESERISLGTAVLWRQLLLFSQTPVLNSTEFSIVCSIVYSIVNIVSYIV